MKMRKPIIYFTLKGPFRFRRFWLFYFNTWLLIIEWLYFEDDFEKYRQETKEVIMLFKEKFNQ